TPHLPPFPTRRPSDLPLSSFSARSKATPARLRSFLETTQLVPPGTPLAHNTGGDAPLGASAPAKTDNATSRVAARIRMKNARCIRLILTRNRGRVEPPVEPGTFDFTGFRLAE